MAPCRSQRTTSPMPRPSSSLVTAMPAAPAPLIVTCSSSMLIVVEDGHVESLTQLALDFEAAGRTDVLEIDATEIRSDVLDDADDLVDVARGKTDRKRLDTGQGLQQNCLALHHR